MMAAAIQAPAICDDCLTVFPSGFAFGEGASFTLSGNRTGPCPNCGGVGTVVNGRFEIVNGVMRGLDSTALDDLRSLARILGQSRDRDEVMRRVANEAPSAAWIAESAPGAVSAASWTGYVMVILMLIQIWLMAQDDVPTEVHNEINIIQNELQIELDTDPSVDLPPESPAPDDRPDPQPG